MHIMWTHSSRCMFSNHRRLKRWKHILPPKSNINYTEDMHLIAESFDNNLLLYTVSGASTKKKCKNRVKFGDFLTFLINF